MAKDLITRIGSASNKDVIDLINSGGIINCPVSAQDVYRALRIYGPDISAIKGKSTNRKPVAVKIEYIPRPIVATQVLHMDIIFISGKKLPFLFSISIPLGLKIVTDLHWSREAAAVQTAISSQLSIYRAENYIFSSIVCDGEKAFGKLKDWCGNLGVRMQPTGPNQHVECHG
jgi:hypothetical protein